MRSHQWKEDPSDTTAAKLRVVAIRMLVAAVCCSSCASVATGLPYPPPPDVDDRMNVHQHRLDLEVPEPYKFEYAVHDPTTGDMKSHNEVGDEHGGVKGSYMLVEADGSTRVVEYTADDEHGFQARVKKIGPPHQPSSVEPHRPSAEAHQPTFEPYRPTFEPYQPPAHHAKPAPFRSAEYKQIVVPAAVTASAVPPAPPSPSVHVPPSSVHAGEELHWYVPETQDLPSR